MTPKALVRSMVATLALAVGACSSTSSPPAGSGGSQGTGGASSQAGGATATGGATLPGGSGGRSGGGGAGSGGKSGSGGAGAGGAQTGTGGATATATAGSGAPGGADGGRPPGSGGVGGGAAGQPGMGGSTTAGGRDGGPGSGGSGGPAIDGGGSGAAVASAGCGKTPTLKNSPTATANQNTLSISGTSRQFLIRWPSNYDNTHPYRLILDFHGATGKDTDLAPSYFGLFDLSGNSTIFIAPSADGGLWNATTDSAFVDQILKTVEADLCIDTSRVELEGFSQGAAMVWTLACGRPGVFRAAVGHSGGGLANPTSCQPIPYLGSLGLQEGNGQNTQTDQFAKWDGCTITTLPRAPTGGHVCTPYTGCPTADPVVWCSYDGGHTPSPTDSGKSTSWMPAEVWPFLSQF